MENNEINGNTLDYNNLGFNMMLMAFKDNNLHANLQKSLLFATMFTKSSDVILFILDNNGKYSQLISGTNAFYSQYEDIASDKDVLIIPLFSHKEKYIVAIKDSAIKNLSQDIGFISVFTDSMNTILNQMEYCDELKKKSNIDELTGLNNRNSYQDAVINLDNNNEPFVLVVFDLFRLKFINDNYSYALGDEYIIKAAEILKKYFPKYITYYDEDGMVKKKPTGSCIYRYGGDEFVLINKKEPLDEIINKIAMVCHEGMNIDLNMGEELKLGINYGIAIRGKGESVKDVSINAGDEMKKDKTKMYKLYGLERRK